MEQHRPNAYRQFWSWGRRDPNREALPKSLWASNPGQALLGLGVFATILSYIAVVRFDFVYDDIVQIVQNPVLHSWRYFPRYFVEHNWASLFPHSPGNYYRPLMLTWKLISYTVFGANPSYWHLTNLALHVGATLLVYALAKKLTYSEPVGAVAALIFGLHPVNVEVVAWVSGATDSILALLLLTSFLLYVRCKEQPASQPARKYLFLGCSLLLYGLATLTKEIAVMLPFMIVAYEWWFSRPAGDDNAAGNQESAASPASRARPFGKALLRAAPYAILTACYLGLRYRVLGGFGHNTAKVQLGTELLTIPSVLWFYIKMLVAPSDLSPFYNLAYVTAVSLSRFFLPFSAIILVAGLSLWAARKSRAVRFAILWFALPVVPVLRISVFPSNDFVHDRYLYLPSIGFSILAALGLRQLGRLIISRVRPDSPHYARITGLRTIAPIFLIGILGAVTANQTRIWQNEIVLYGRAIARAPDNLEARLNLAAAFIDRRQYDQAIDILSSVLADKPGVWNAAFNLGLVYERLGKLGDSERFYDRAIQIDPSQSQPFCRKAVVDLEMSKLGQAESLARQAIAISPGEAGYHALLGVVLEKESRDREALDEFRAEAANYPEEEGVAEQVREIEHRIGSATYSSP